MYWRSLLFSSAIGLVAYAWFVKNNLHNPARIILINAPAGTGVKNNTAVVRLKNHSSQLLSYAKQKSYNTNHAFLIDMKLTSGSNRFFVYDLKKDSVLKSGLVTHGYGNNDQRISFSNIPGSYCTSLGKYKIGKPYNGRFGLAYKLYGLDSSNSNAINRYIVLHSHACVPDAEVAPELICMSQGCPTVAPAFLKQLATFLDMADKPILLYIFY